jgi:hypothetical protein
MPTAGRHFLDTNKLHVRENSVVRGFEVGSPLVKSEAKFKSPCRLFFLSLKGSLKPFGFITKEKVGAPRAHTASFFLLKNGSLYCVLSVLFFFFAHYYWLFSLKKK